MAFTEAQLQAQVDSSGLCCRITKFDAAGASATDVGIQNLNTSAEKTGLMQIAQSNTAAQAAALLLARFS